MAQAVEAPSAMDGMADDERRQNLFSLSSVFVSLRNGSRLLRLTRATWAAAVQVQRGRVRAYLLML